MNKEILKRNIEQVIMQPGFANPWNKADKKIKENGLSEDGTHIMVKTKCDDSSSQIRLKWCNNGVYEDIDFVEEILKRLPEKYRDHLITIKHDAWISYSYVPVFDTDTQAMWDKELSDFYDAKQAWCDKYGCD
jgi:hypothetical protein